MSKSVTKQFIPAIDKGVDIPDSRKKREKEIVVRVNWPFLSMEHGDSFLLPKGCDKKKAYSALSAMKNRNQIDKNVSLVIRKENTVFRVWLVNQVK